MVILSSKIITIYIVIFITFVLITIYFMEAFVSTDNNHFLYYDYPFYKKVNKNGSIADITNSDALAQAVKIWLVY